MAGIYAARLFPDRGQKSDEKTGRKNTSRARGISRSLHTTGAGKKGVTRQHIGIIVLKPVTTLGILKRSPSFLSSTTTTSSTQLMKCSIHNATFSTVGAYSTHPCILISRKCENVARKKERIFCFLICLRKK